MVSSSSVFAQATAVLASVTVGIFAFGSAPSAHAQAVPRITGTVDSSALVSLPGEVHPWARPQFDRGAAPDNASGHLLLVLQRSPQQEAALRQLLASQKDPKSPNYHKWLTPNQFGAQFGVSDADLQTVAGYLSAQGMRVDHISDGHMAMDVEATAGQIRSAFKTSIHAYSVGGKTFYANSSAPQIPAALTSVVRGFASMNNFHVAGGAGAGTQASFDPATHTLHALYSNNSSSPATYGVSPGDLRTIYDIPATTGAGLGGANVRVGVIGDSDINVSYVNNYNTIFATGAAAPIVVVDGNDPGMNADAAIAYKQIELINAVAPKAQVYYYTSATTDYDTGIDFAIVRAVDDANVQVLVNGFQQCETANTPDVQQFITSMAEQAAAEGITFVAAAGNSGADACASPGASGSAAGAAYAINGYASSGFLTAVGGTDFYYGALAMSSYWGANNGYSSAKTYIPEQVWNDSYSANNGSNAVYGNSVQLAGGGGVSTAGEGTSTPEPMPSYQLANSRANQIGGGVARVIPDVSFFAGSGASNTLGYNNTAYMFCMASTDCQASTKQFTYGGGTEAAAAVFAGAVALAVEQYNAGSPYGLGNINQELYAELGKTMVSHDITIGTNALACSSGANCSNGNNMDGYNAGTGYDAATGLGSFDIGSFVTNFKPINTTASKISLSLIDASTGLPPVCVSNGVTTPNCTMHSTNITFTAVASSASGSGAAPTGDVSIITKSPLAAEANFTGMRLSGGTATATLNTLPGGTYSIYARYAGDATYAPSLSATPYTITVKPEACQMILYGHNVNVGSMTSIPYGTPVSITVEPYSSVWTGNVGIPSGSISVTDNGASLTSLPFNSEGSATFSSNALAAGSHSINLTFGGDASFSSCSIGPFLATITQAATTTVLTPSSSDLNSGSTTLTATVEATPLTNGSTTYPSNGVPPSGTVTFYDGNGNAVQTSTLVPGFDSSGNAMAAASYTISNIPNGGTLQAVYNGDSHYASSASATSTIQSTTSILGNYPSTTAFQIMDSLGNPTDSSANPAYPYQAYPAKDTLTLNIQVPNDTTQVCVLFVCLTQTIPSNYGTVSVLANGVTLASGIPLDGNGNATYTLPMNNGTLALPSGQVLLTVSYSGYTQNIIGLNIVSMGSSSVTIPLNIKSDVTGGDFSLQSTTTVNQGKPLLAAANVTSAAYGLQLTSLYGYAGNVSLSCAVTGYSNGGVRSTVPTGLGCSLSNNTVALSSGFGTSTLTVSAASGYTIADNTTPASRWWMAAGGTTLACLFLFGLPGERRKWQATLAASVLVLVSFGITGCGANFSSTSNTNSQLTSKLTGGTNDGTSATGSVAAGTYTVTVTGVATLSNGTTVTHTAPVQVLVGTTN